MPTFTSDWSEVAHTRSQAVLTVLHLSGFFAARSFSNFLSSVISTGRFARSRNTFPVHKHDGELERLFQTFLIIHSHIRQSVCIYNSFCNTKIKKKKKTQVSVKVILLYNRVNTVEERSHNILCYLE